MGLTDTIREHGLDYNVRKVQLHRPYFDEELGNQDLPSKAYAMVREDTGQEIGIVSKNYTPLQNVDAFSAFDPLLKAGAKVDTAGCSADGSKAWISLDTGVEIDVKKGDSVRNFVLLSNSHDGTVAAKLGFTPKRILCDNMLVMVTRQMVNTVRVLHRGNASDQLEAAVNILDVASSGFKSTVEEYKSLTKGEFSDDTLADYISEVFYPGKLSKTGLAKGERIRNKILPLMGQDSTWWNAYNGVTEYLTHHKGKDEQTRKDQNLFGASRTANRRALSLALKYSYGVPF